MIPEQLTDALAATPGADDWQYTLLSEDEAQLYLIGSQVEEQRRVTNTRAAVALYNDHPPANGDAESTTRGATSLTIASGELDDPARLAARLNEGVAMAR